MIRFYFYALLILIPINSNASIINFSSTPSGYLLGAGNIELIFSDNALNSFDNLLTGDELPNTRDSKLSNSSDFDIDISEITIGHNFSFRVNSSNLDFTGSSGFLLFDNSGSDMELSFNYAGLELSSLARFSTFSSNNKYYNQSIPKPAPLTLLTLSLIGVGALLTLGLIGVGYSRREYFKPNR